VIQPETIAGRKQYFRKKREAFVATWRTDENGVVHIPLAHSHEAIFNQRHLPAVSQFLWRLKKHSVSNGKCRGVIKLYVEATVAEELRHIYGRTTSLHRVIMEAPKSEVDHRDSNGLNCLDSNLRPATKSQNTCNRRYKNSTGYRGVVRQPRCKKNPFRAQIDYGGVNHYLGGFRTAALAAKAYNAEALRVFGDFAILNEMVGA